MRLTSSSISCRRDRGCVRKVFFRKRVGRAGEALPDPFVKSFAVVTLAAGLHRLPVGHEAGHAHLDRELDLLLAIHRADVFAQDRLDLAAWALPVNSDTSSLSWNFCRAQSHSDPQAPFRVEKGLAGRQVHLGNRLLGQSIRN